MTPPNNIRQIKSRIMKLIGACVRNGGNGYRFWWGNLMGINLLEDLGVDGIMLKYALKK
jgi:hypothetical protein